MIAVVLFVLVMTAVLFLFETIRLLWELHRLEARRRPKR